MQHRSRRIFQWFNLALCVFVVLLLEVYAVSMVLYPRSRGEFWIAWAFIVTSVVFWTSLARFFARRWRSKSAA